MYLEQIEDPLPHYARPYDEEALKSPEGASTFPAKLLSSHGSTADDHYGYRAPTAHKLAACAFWL